MTFSGVDICTNCGKSTVGKTAGVSAGIEAGHWNALSHCDFHWHTHVPKTEKEKKNTAS